MKRLLVVVMTVTATACTIEPLPVVHLNGGSPHEMVNSCELWESGGFFPGCEIACEPEIQNSSGACDAASSPNTSEVRRCPVTFTIEGHVGCCQPVLDTTKYHIAFFECPAATP